MTTLDPKTTFEDAVKKEQEKDGMSSTEEKVTIAGSSGVKITTKLCKAASCKVVEWFFPRGNELYHFSTIYPDLSYSPNFDKMISSFKFTDEGAGTEKLTGAELDKMLNGGVIPKSKIALNAKAPSDLKKLLADTAQKSAFPWFKGPVDLTYNFESVDLNGDGVREFVVTLLEACGSSVRGASGNGPIYVYQKKSGVWENTGDLGGSTYSIQNKKTDGYYDIMTYWHISCCSGTVDNYAWDNASSSYKKVSSKNVEIKESDNSN